jgi:quercetin dioxygenase-like cupin family protein
VALRTGGYRVTVEYTWEGELLRWELRPDGDGCLLVFTTTFDDRAKAARDATGWHFCLDNLEEALAGRKAPDAKDRFAELSADYAARIGLGEFPVFMKNPANRIADGSRYTSGIERHVFDDADGTLMELWHTRSDTVLPEEVHDFDEYVLVVEGEYVLSLNGKTFPLRPGQEFVIPRHARISARLTAGTRTVHAFGGRPASFGTRAPARA